MDPFEQSFYPVTLVKDYAPREGINEQLPEPRRQVPQYYYAVGMSRKKRGERTYKWGRVRQRNPVSPQPPFLREALHLSGLGARAHRRAKKVLKGIYKQSYIRKAKEGIRNDLAVEYVVKSETKKNVKYNVYWNGDCKLSTCDCLDWKWNQECKHIRAVMRFRRRSIAIAPAHDYLEGTYSDSLENAADNLEYEQGEQTAQNYADQTGQGFVRDPLGPNGTALQ
jgi:hypothetical protein